LKQVNLIFRKELKRLVKVVISLLTKIKKHKMLCKKLANKCFKLLKIINKIGKLNSKELTKMSCVSNALLSDILRSFDLTRLRQHFLYIRQHLKRIPFIALRRKRIWLLFVVSQLSWFKMSFFVNVIKSYLKFISSFKKKSY